MSIAVNKKYYFFSLLHILYTKRCIYMMRKNEEDGKKDFFTVIMIVQIALCVLLVAGMVISFNGSGKFLETILESYNALMEDDFTEDDAKAVAQKSAMRYDREGDDHFDILSALMKSLRGSDPDAALHYLARMLEEEKILNFLL